MSLPTNVPVIIGAGIAGLATALSLAPLPVIVISKEILGAGATIWAQGGIAASVSQTDTPHLHSADTMAVSGGLGTSSIADMIAGEAANAVAALENWGVHFDREANGDLILGLEAGHSRRRIVHAGGDSTGRFIIEALLQTARATPSITLVENTKAHSLIVEEGRLVGLTLEQNGKIFTLPCPALVLATGGIGHLYRHTTNPAGAVGDGLALAAFAGAKLQDLEFIQFHPTAIDLGLDPMPLASEALRGEGAHLITETGALAMNGVDHGDLSPRDVVAGHLWKLITKGEKIFLDCCKIANLSQRFPSVFRSCVSAGLDPSLTPIPVRPAAHYHMGGVQVDRFGKTSIDGLWACGEVASTGLHGANRLASNSLLEAIIFAKHVAENISSTKLLPAQILSSPSLAPIPGAEDEWRDIMEAHLGVVRNEEGLKAALGAFYVGFSKGNPTATIMYLIALAAYRRQESRGSHIRSDYPQNSDQARHSVLTLAEAKTSIL